MSMSTHVVGIKPPDERWKQMKCIYDACTDANTSMPSEVEDFFNGETPDPLGVTVQIDAREWRHEMSEGYEVALADLPSDVKVIRFYNSY